MLRAFTHSTPLPGLLAMPANHTARLSNIAHLAAPFQLSRQTIHDCFTVLKRIFPWSGLRLTTTIG